MKSARRRATFVLVIVPTLAGLARGAAIAFALVAASASKAVPIQWQVGDGGNDHFYEAVIFSCAGGGDTCKSWTDAKSAAEAMGGHLATLTSAAENDFAKNLILNDSGFWIYKQMSGLTEAEALKTWTPLLAILGTTGFVCALLGSLIIPYP